MNTLKLALPMLLPLGKKQEYPLNYGSKKSFTLYVLCLSLLPAWEITVNFSMFPLRRNDNSIEQTQIGSALVC